MRKLKLLSLEVTFLIEKQKLSKVIGNNNDLFNFLEPDSGFNCFISDESDSFNGIV